MRRAYDNTSRAGCFYGNGGGQILGNAVLAGVVITAWVVCFCVEINFGRPTPSTRRRPQICICSIAWRFTNLPHRLISTQVFLMFPFFTVLKGAGLFRVSDEVEDEGLDMSKHGGAAYEIDVRARRPPFNVP